MDKIKKIDIELMMIRTTKLPFVLGKEELTKEEVF